MTEPADLPRFRALLEWRQGLLDSGIPADELPIESDLRRIARSPDKHGFKRLGLVRPDAVRRFQPGILVPTRPSPSGAQWNRLRVELESALSAASAVTSLNVDPGGYWP